MRKIKAGRWVDARVLAPQYDCPLAKNALGIGAHASSHGLCVPACTGQR